MTFTLTLSNEGPSAANAVAVTDQLPTGYTYVSDTGGGAYSNLTGVWNVGTLAAGGSETVDITATVNAAGVYLNVAEVTASEQADPDSTPNNGVTTEDDYAEQSTAPVAPTPAVTMTETVTDVNGGSLVPGDQLLYTITVTNSGTADATFVVVTDPIPANTTLMAGSLASDDPTDITVEGNPLSVDVGTLFAPGNGDNDVVITYSVTVDLGVPAGTMISNQAILTAEGGINRISDDPTANDGLETGNDPLDPADDDPTMAGPTVAGTGAILTVAMTADQREVQRGEFVLYTITVTNPTAAAVSFVDLQNSLPVGVTLVSGTVTVDGVPAPDPVPAIPSLFPIGTINPGQTVTLVYRAVVGSGSVIGELVNAAMAVDNTSSPLSLPASVAVRLIEDTEFDLATIVGRVFDDRDEDGRLDRGEKGIGGVMVAMEDGVYAITDNDGFYHIAAVRPGNRLIKVNRHSMPPFERMTLPESNILTVTPGLLVKVNFAAKISDARTLKRGRPASYGIQLTREKPAAQTEIVGNLEDMTVVVNGVLARLPKAHARMDVMSLERNLTIVDGRLEKPAVFELSYPSDRSVKEWRFEIFDADMQLLRDFRGTDADTKQVVWDGEDAGGKLVSGSEIYQYQLTIEFEDGSLAKSPVRMFGVDLTKAISFELTGALFETNQATLHTTAAGILDEIAATLKQHPKEKVVVSGHTDSTGSVAWNHELSLRRAEAVRDYLVEAGISENQLLIKGRGSAYPVASNDTYAGRARNRRVEVKALLEETDLARVYASEIDAGAREVVVNDQAVAAETDGSFRTTLNQLEETGRVSLGIRTDDGGLTATTVHLPTITITEPSSNGKLEIGRRERVLELMEPEIVNGGVHHPKVEIPVRGRTEPGNMVFIDGEPAPVSASGSFETKVPLTVGENTFGIVAIGPGGHTNVVNLDVDLSGKDADQQLIVVKPPIPQFTIELPPRDAVLPNPSLFVRGTADPLATVTINKTKFPVANDGAFAGTLTLPEGNSFIQVKVSMPDGSSTQLGVPITVKQNYFFVVALGDATVNSIETKGPVPEKYQDEVYVDGRLAFYLKGRIKGKYLLTAAMDTGEGRLEDIGDRLGERNNNDFFRTLDPDEFYPVYGDGSTTGRDVNSQGPFYVMFEAPTYSAEWGNFNSGITGTEFASFNRTLYGGKGTWTTLRKREHGEPVGRAIVFAAQPETRSGHDEFLGTGGSLYFLRNRDVARGSEKVRLEVRDKITGIAVANQAMRNYVDYEIDYAEGRLLFRRPVNTVSASSTIISDGLLNGNEVHVIVDYEYHELSTSIDESTYGARATSAVSDHISVGATYVKEERATSTYDLVGGDVSVRLGDQTRMTAEFSQSDNTLLPQYVSTDGGLSFVAKPVPITGDTNQAYRLDMATGAGPFKATGYFRHIDAGFSSSFATGLADVDQYGATLGFKIGGSGQLKLMFDERDTQGVSDVLTGTLQYQQRIGKFGITAEGRYRDSENVLSPDTTEGIGAIRFDFHATPGVNLFARHQTDFHQEVGGVSATTGIKEQSTIGVDAKITNNITAKAELTTAEAGDSALVGLSTRIDEDTILYGTYTMSPDHASGVTDTVTAGAATDIGDRTRVYTEQQFKNGRDQLTTTNVVGLNVRVNDKLTAGVNVQRTNLDGAGAGPDTLRQAASGSVSYVHPRFKVFSKLELRQDEGTAVDREQWVTSNAFEVKLSKDFSLQGRLNYGETTDNLTNTEESVYDELSFGFAYRPHNHDWVNALARYTKVRNLSPMSQVLITQDDREDQVFAFQIAVDLNRHLTLTEKLARRDQTLTPALLAQLESELKLWINRFDYHLSDKWDAALEYRLLSIEDAADNQADGFLLEVNRLLMGHLRFGLGYNFTNFSDDALTANDYEVKGFFFRVQGKY